MYLSLKNMIKKNIVLTYMRKQGEIANLYDEVRKQNKLF